MKNKYYRLDFDGFELVYGNPPRLPQKKSPKIKSYVDPYFDEYYG